MEGSLRQSHEVMAKIGTKTPWGDVSKKVAQAAIESISIGREFATFLLNRGSAESVLVMAYALNLSFVAQALLKLLEPKLSETELFYVKNEGPKIILELWRHDEAARFTANSNARKYRHNAKVLEESAKTRLTDAGVSNERQQLLSDLVRFASTHHLRYFRYTETNVVHYNMKALLENGVWTRFEELATFLAAPEEIQKFLKLVHNAAKELRQKEEEK